MPSRVVLPDKEIEGKGTSYRDNKDGTIHVTHYDNDKRTSYDVDYGQPADNSDGGQNVHTTEQK